MPKRSRGSATCRSRGGITTTLAHRDEAANGEDDEIEEMDPRFIREAGGDGRADAAASFRLALEREKHHRVMFKDAACKQEAARSKTRLIAISRRSRCNIPAAANDR